MNPLCLTNRFFGLGILLLALAGGARAGAQETSSFGSSKMSGGGAALIGILYDLKQTQQRQPTAETPKSYRGVVTEFLESNWDQGILNRYFRVTRALYTTQIFIPSMNADEAPKAFGVSDVVKPRMWLVHYKGQAAPAEGGVYRFLGDADDILAVRINGRLLLVAGRPDCLPPKSVWHSTEPDSRGMTFGDWISLKAGEIVDLDFIIGERPGGIFRAIVWIEKQGVSSGQRPPLFKLAPSSPGRGDYGPDTSWSIWSAKQ